MDTRLADAVTALEARDHPTLTNPINCKKRASVALIVRRPKRCKGAQAAELPTFDEAEVLFIKRAERKGDRWTSHVAFPGGKREPADDDDQETAVRETQEEVGLDISSERCIKVLKLPERLISTSWTQVPLMVLCPYVFFLRGDQETELSLQPAEVASAHWVPLRLLAAPALQTQKPTPFSDRMRLNNSLLLRVFLRLSAGDMLFPAVLLVPSVSTFSVPSPENLKGGNSSGYLAQIWSLLSATGPRDSHIAATGAGSPLVCWGITYGIVCELSQLVPGHSADRPSYPTFSHWDLRFIIHLLTFSFRQAKSRELMRSTVEDVTTMTSSVHGHGADSATVKLLDGYYGLVRRAIVVALVSRTLLTTIVCLWLLQKSHYLKMLRPRRSGLADTVRRKFISN